MKIGIVFLLCCLSAVAGAFVNSFVATSAAADEVMAQAQLTDVVASLPPLCPQLTEAEFMRIFDSTQPMTADLMKKCSADNMGGNDVCAQIVANFERDAAAVPILTEMVDRGIVFK